MVYFPGSNQPDCLEDDGINIANVGAQTTIICQNEKDDANEQNGNINAPLNPASVDPGPAYVHPDPAPAYGHPAPAPAYGHPAPAPAYGHPAPAPAYGHPASTYGSTASYSDNPDQTNTDTDTANNGSKGEGFNYLDFLQIPKYFWSVKIFRDGKQLFVPEQKMTCILYRN